VCALDEFYFGDDRCVHREDTLYADAVADLSDSESFTETFTSAPKDNAFIDLNTFFA